MSSVAGINEIKFQHTKSVDSKTSFGKSPQAEEKKNSAKPERSSMQPAVKQG